MGRLLALVGGERGVIFALSPALADAVGVRLVRISDVLINFHNKLLRNDCNAASKSQHFH
jgi:hypothetical protein